MGVVAATVVRGHTGRGRLPVRRFGNHRIGWRTAPAAGLPVDAFRVERVGCECLPVGADGDRCEVTGGVGGDEVAFGVAAAVQFARVAAGVAGGGH